MARVTDLRATFGCRSKAFPHEQSIVHGGEEFDADRSYDGGSRGSRVQSGALLQGNGYLRPHVGRLRIEEGQHIWRLRVKGHAVLGVAEDDLDPNAVLTESKAAWVYYTQFDKLCHNGSDVEWQLGGKNASEHILTLRLDVDAGTLTVDRAGGPSLGVAFHGLQGTRLSLVACPCGTSTSEVQLLHYEPVCARVITVHAEAVGHAVRLRCFGMDGSEVATLLADSTEEIEALKEALAAHLPQTSSQLKLATTDARLIDDRMLRLHDLTLPTTEVR